MPDRPAGVPLSIACRACSRSVRRAATTRVWRSTTGWWMHCWARRSSRGSRCTTGTCRRGRSSVAGCSTAISALWFADYAALVVDRLSDRVSHWMTLQRAAGVLQVRVRRRDQRAGLRLSLKSSCRRSMCRCSPIRAAGSSARAKRPARVGWAVVGRTDFPVAGARRGGRRELERRPAALCATERGRHRCARRSMMGITTRDLWNNTWYNDPVFFGEYPEDG